MSYYRIAIERVRQEVSSSRLKVANRSYFGPVITNLNRRDRYTRGYFDFCRKVLLGDQVAIFVFEGASIAPDEYSYEYQPLLAEAARSIATELSKLKSEFPKTKFFLSLAHRGPQGSSALSQRALLGPTPYLDVTSGEVCAEATMGQVEELIDDYVTAAKIAIEVGFHGIEIAAGQYSIIRAFLSPLTNQRNDEYGWDRGLLLRSVIQRISKSAEGGIIGVRQSIDELAPWGGFGPEEAADEVVKLEKEVPGTIGYILCERGSIFSTAETEADYSAGSLYNVEATDRYLHRISEVLGDDRPLIVDSGGIYDDGDIEEILSRSRKVELIDLTRPIIADPYLLDPNHAPRSCIACNQGCLVGDSRNFPISCAVNPTIAPEIEAPKRLGLSRRGAKPPSSAAAAKIAVVGGGVAGITAALKLSETKYQVTLFEESSKLGGQLRRFATTHPNQRLANLLNQLTNEVNESKIKLELEALVSNYSDLDDFDEVVVATGARFRPRTSASIANFEVTNPIEANSAMGQLDPMLLFDPKISISLDTDSKIIFYDVVGDDSSRAIVKRLITLGLRFTYICPDPVAFSQLALSHGLVEGNATLIRSGAELIFEAKVGALEDRSCLVEEIYSQYQRVIDFDYFIESNRYFAQDQTFRNGRGLLIGDALAPRSIRSAITEGSRLIEEVAVALNHSTSGAGL